MPADSVNDVICGSLMFVLKTQHTSGMSAICDAFSIAQTESKATAKHMAQALDVIECELENTMNIF
jgi:hypothetical protein